jgi:FG-GAP-like repeat
MASSHGLSAANYLRMKPGEISSIIAGSTIIALLQTAHPAAAQFTEIDPGMAQPPFPCVAVGDYDNDGDMDVLVAGLGRRDVPFTIIYQNTGGTFADSGVVLPGLSRAAAAWGDFDGDGDLDLAMTGLSGSGLPTTRIYRNDGGTFTALTNAMMQVFAGNIVWGDYDGDGDLDLLVTGINSASAAGVAFTRLYRNDANGVFTSVSHPFPDCYLGAASWGDYDNDGHLDLVLAGATTGGGLACAVWHNDGHGGFTNIAAPIPAMDLGFASWGDYDNDGDLDLLFGGNTDAGFVTTLYRNELGTFTNINPGLVPVLWASAAWGDYDNDGDLDAIVIGYDPVAQTSRSILYRNNGGGSFTDSGATFHNLYLGTVSWVDYDNDGRLDLVMAGNETGTGDVLRLAHSTVSTTNTAPLAPTKLAVNLDGINADFFWSAASDAQTPTTALTYNLRVGTIPGGSQVVAPQSAPSGFLRLPAMGSAQLARVATLHGLTPGVTYYWSVQAVDGAFAGSPFATEASFVALPAAPLNVSFARSGEGTIHTIWRGTPGTPYRVEVSPDLFNWTTLTTLTAADGTGLFELVETPAAGITQRFYRAIYP